MNDLREIYQDIILDHYRKPRNFSELEGASHQASGHNPLCGDRVQVFLHVDEGVVKEITFKGDGCAISTASASLMTEAVKGKPVAEVVSLFERFHSMVTTPPADGSPEEDLGKLEALSGIRQLPVRVKCATLAWHTLQAALKSINEEPVVSTE
jgi:nitrogen fixation NifU-like protein